MEHEFSKVARFWYQYFRFVYILREILKEIAKFDFSIFLCKFKVKMARRSKVLKDLKNSLKFLPSIRNRFFDRVVLLIKKVVKKFKTSDGVLKKAMWQKYCFVQGNLNYTLILRIHS